VAIITAAVTSALLGAALLSGFHVPLQPIAPDADQAASEIAGRGIIGIRTLDPPLGIEVEADLEYGTRDDGTLLTLDVCSLPAPAPGRRPAVVSVHGGSWARGDKANSDWRLVCEWLASEGFVAYSVNYRLVPDVTFPAAIDDVGLAVQWLREPENAKRFGIDPERVGVFGGSAGANLAALLGTRGEGPVDEGSRVAAVAGLSGPMALGADALDDGGASEWLRGIIADYLGCADAADCAADHEASPITHIDPSDPPVFIGHAENEVVPLGQSLRYAKALTEAGVPTELAIVPGAEHSIGILDESMRARVAGFLHAHLG
jgi:acetyl esterase